MTKLYKFQRAGVRLIAETDGRTLLADEMGLGKTIQILTYWMKYVEGPLLVVCPANLKWNWLREALTHIGERAYVCESRRPPRRGIRGHYRIVICNFDILGSWLTTLQDFEFEMLAVDEGHYVKNPKAQRTKYVKDMSRYCDKAVIATGTPVTNRPAELWALLNIIWPNKFRSFPAFGFKYCKPEIVRGRLEYRGARNLPHLHKRLKRLGMIRRLKADVLDDLPAKRIITVPMHLNAAQRKEYEFAESDFLSWLKQESPQKAARARRSERLLRIGYLKRLVAKLKMENVLAWIDNFLEEDEGKLILFSFHKSVISQIHEKYDRLSVRVSGATPKNKRESSVDKFQNDKRCRLFNGQITAAGVGLTLTAASNLAMVELPWTPAELNQCFDRSHRIGQKESVSCYCLITMDTVEEDILDTLDKKQAVSDAIVDGKDAQDFDLVDRLIEATQQRASRRKRKAKK